jgi:hypothetical protein
MDYLKSLYKYALSKFLKRFYTKKSYNKSYKRHLSALLAEFIIEFYNKKTINIK